MRFSKVLRYIGIVLFFLTVFVEAVPSYLLHPDNDSFYKAPSGFENQEPGTILKVRETPRKIKSVFLPVNMKNSWQLLVRSTDTHGNATAIVTTLMEPYNAHNDKLLSYQTAQDSSNTKCAPSYGLQKALDFGTIIYEFEMVAMLLALERGWWVVTPDYEGLQSAFTAGRQSGRATLDSIRGVLNFRNETAMSEDVKISLWGYSGGTIASGWAAALQPSYAKELKGHFLGAAMGGFVTNVTGTAVGVDGTVFAGLIAPAIHGLVNEYPQLQGVVDKQLVPSKKKKYEMAGNMCLPEAILKFAYDFVFEGEDRFVEGGWDLFKDPTVKEVVDNVTLATNPNAEIPDMPLFVYHGAVDTVVPFDQSVRVYDFWCKHGIKSYEFAVDNTAGHVTEALEGTGAAIAWLENIFNGTAPVTGCQRTNRQSNVHYPGSSKAIKELLYDVVKGIAGKKVGPGMGIFGF